MKGSLFHGSQYFFERIYFQWQGPEEVHNQQRENIMNMGVGLNLTMQSSATQNKIVFKEVELH